MSPLERKIGSSVLVICVPLLLLALVGLVGGSLALGSVELTLIWLIWLVGLIWVWFPRKGSR